MCRLVTHACAHVCACVLNRWVCVRIDLHLLRTQWCWISRVNTHNNTKIQRHVHTTHQTLRNTPDLSIAVLFCILCIHVYIYIYSYIAYHEQRSWKTTILIDISHVVSEAATTGHLRITYRSWIPVLNRPYGRRQRQLWQNDMYSTECHWIVFISLTLLCLIDSSSKYFHKTKGVPNLFYHFCINW